MGTLEVGVVDAGSGSVVERTDVERTDVVTVLGTSTRVVALPVVPLVVVLDPPAERVLGGVAVEGGVT